MKLKMIPAVILATMAVAGAAQAQVSVYGLVDVGFSHADGRDDMLKYSNNSTTKIGLKGETNLGSGITGKFQLEAGGIAQGGKQISMASEGFFDRQAWVGLAGGFGEVRGGIQDSTAFKTLAGFDLNGLANDTQASALAGLNTVGQNGLVPNKGLTKEVAQYSTPNMGGFQATVGLTPQGDVKTLNGDPAGKGNLSLGLSYAKGGLGLGLAYESASSDNAALQNSNAYSAVGASYNFGVATVAGVFVNGGTGQRGMQIGVAANVAGATLGVQYAKNTDTSFTGTEFFANKEVLKNTTAYFEYGTQSPSVGNKVNVYSVGMIYTF